MHQQNEKSMDGLKHLEGSVMAGRLRKHDSVLLHILKHDNKVAWLQKASAIPDAWPLHMSLS